MSAQHNPLRPLAGMARVVTWLLGIPVGRS
jgi:hypothetical protein